MLTFVVFAVMMVALISLGLYFTAQPGEWPKMQIRAWLEKRRNSPQAKFRREQKRKKKLSAELEKVSKKIAHEVGRLKSLKEAERHLSKCKNPDHVVSWLKRENDWSVVQNKLLLRRKSPLRLWMKTWINFSVGYSYYSDSQGETVAFPAKGSVNKGHPGWNAVDDYELACKHQREEWDASRKVHLAKARELQQRVNELSKALGVEVKDWLSEFESACYMPEEPASACVEETPRDKLAKVRARIAEHREEETEIEQEILNEEQANAPGPHRRAAGVNTDG